MTLTNIGIGLTCVGLVFLWGNSPIPPRGFKAFRPLLDEYRRAKEAGKKASPDAEGAFVHLIQYRIGGTLVALGGMLILVDLSIGG